MEFLQSTYFGNTVQDWLLTLGTTLVVLAVLRVAVFVGGGRLKRLSQRTENKWDDILSAAVQQTKPLMLLLVALYVGMLPLTLPERVDAGSRVAATIAFFIQVGFWLNAAIAGWMAIYREKNLEDDVTAVMSMNVLVILARVVVWSLVLLVSLENLGVDVTALVAGLGIGGVAVALAAQNVLGDLFASLSIVIDKPFVLGDLLIVGDQLGSVEQIGMKTTRLRSLSGEQIVFGNGDLLSSRVRNYGRMYERRVPFKIGVVYQTSREQLEMIPGILREAVEAQGEDRVRFDRSHFQSYGDFALVFETVYYVLSPDYTVYMDCHQAINLRIFQRFEEEGIEFAYPTQTLFLAKEGKDS